MDATYTFMRMWITKDWVPFEVLRILYGISRDDEALWGGFRAWPNTLRRPREVIRPDEINRHFFETFLQQSGLLPLKWAAARLGMQDDSFNELFEALRAKGRISEPDVFFTAQTVRESFIRSIHQIFPDLKHRVFGDYNSFCLSLHRAIKKNLKIRVKGLFCVTSRALKEEPMDFAYEFDCLNGEPVGLRYQVWLDTKKPINLRPDVCSTKLYYEHEEELKHMLFSTQKPDIPQKLRKIAAG